MNYVLVGKIEAGDEGGDISYATTRLAYKTRAHLVRLGSEIYVNEEEKERFETNLIKHSDHWATKPFSFERYEYKTILKLKGDDIVCPRYYTRCRTKGNCNY